MQPWLVYVPASFMVHLNNLKAYRLSIFLRANGKTPKPFTHWHVMRATLLLTAVTVVLVGISVAIDPAIRTRIVYDVYRPRLDEYHCVNKGPGLGLFWFLLVMHVIASIACVISVRNGSEAFRDGATIKEAFIILYAFIVITLVSRIPSRTGRYDSNHLPASTPRPLLHTPLLHHPFVHPLNSLLHHPHP